MKGLGVGRIVYERFRSRKGSIWKDSNWKENIWKV